MTAAPNCGINSLSSYQGMKFSRADPNRCKADDFCNVWQEVSAFFLPGAPISIITFHWEERIV